MKKRPLMCLFHLCFHLHLHLFVVFSSTLITLIIDITVMVDKALNPIIYLVQMIFLRGSPVETLISCPAASENVGDRNADKPTSKTTPSSKGFRKRALPEEGNLKIESGCVEPLVFSFLCTLSMWFGKLHIQHVSLSGVPCTLHCWEVRLCCGIQIKGHFDHKRTHGG